MMSASSMANHTNQRARLLNDAAFVLVVAVENTLVPLNVQQIDAESSGHLTVQRVVTHPYSVELSRVCLTIGRWHRERSSWTFRAAAPASKKPIMHVECRKSFMHVARVDGGLLGLVGTEHCRKNCTFVVSKCTPTALIRKGSPQTTMRDPLAFSVHLL